MKKKSTKRSRRDRGAQRAAPDSSSLLSLQPFEPQTVRVATIEGEDGRPVGAACLVSNVRLLTCRHVIEEALRPRRVVIGAQVAGTLIGVSGQPTVPLTVLGLGGTGNRYDFWEDLALLALREEDSERLAIRAVEFATPLVHSGKSFSVMGFPENRPFGLHASGYLEASDRNGLVQMVGNPVIAVAPGFSGAPVWCPKLRAFVGIVVAGEDTRGLAWCIPSRILCRFFPELLVRFRIPPPDRPVINDREVDDPNPVLFGEVSDNGRRRLSAWAKKRGRQGVTIHVLYECYPSAEPARGGFVTFVTYPDFESEGEDAYELFARIENGVAEQYFHPSEGFTLAAIGDAGDTALTLDLCKVKGVPKQFC